MQRKDQGQAGRLGLCTALVLLPVMLCAQAKPKPSAAVSGIAATGDAGGKRCPPTTSATTAHTGRRSLQRRLPSGFQNGLSDGDSQQLQPEPDPARRDPADRTAGEWGCGPRSASYGTYGPGSVRQVADGAAGWNQREMFSICLLRMASRRS